MSIEGNKFVHLHGTFGNGAGLIEAQGVHTGQSLHAVQILHQRLVAGKLEYTDSKGKAGKQHQALRNHANHSGHRAAYRVGQNVAQHKILFPEEQGADGQNAEADDLDNKIDGIHDF